MNDKLQATKLQRHPHGTGLLLQQHVYGLSAEMRLKWEHCLIFNGRGVWFDLDQKKVIGEVVEQSPGIVFLWGSAGTGKTLVLREITRVLARKYARKGDQYRILFCARREATNLRQEFEETHFAG